MKQWLFLSGLLTAATAFAPGMPPPPPDVGTSYEVPYRLTETNHFLVRLRINGKGPFNFLVDTGAPALFVSTETAKKIGVEPAKEDFWTPIDHLEFEGGPQLDHVKARVEDPFQLVGMNALGLPGATIDGILGYTILARFRITLDPTRDRMKWTRLDFAPVEPFIPKRVQGGQPPAEMQAMNALGPVAKFAAMIVGKQPEEKLRPRGLIGIEFSESDGCLTVMKVLPDSPAAKAGVKAGDRLLGIAQSTVASVEAARRAMAGTGLGDRVQLRVRHSGATEEVELTVTTAKGF
ncbi:MAG: PDZ domain-containing protein [Planctomycetota bacterium]|nr:PDZ domain-containing protein [Planctomycetota bacterium]